MDLNKVTDKELEELKQVAINTKDKFIKLLSSKNMAQELNNYDSNGPVDFIIKAKLKNTSHEYKISFVKRAIIQSMSGYLEREIRNIVTKD
jgi:hypothetical protein